MSAMQEEKAVTLSNLGSFEISQLIKTSQSQNGLKHSDFLRYRKYCCQKVKKIRKGLGFSHEKNYVQKQIHLERPNDPKMLQALLFKVEHNWAYAQDLKQTMQNSKDRSQRKQQHVNKKMAKALKWARLLDVICKQRTDARTQQESEAYISYISGIYNHEKQNWEEAVQDYIKAHQIYLDLIASSDSLQSVFYKEKNELLEQSIRYCHQQNNGFILDTVDVIKEKMGKKKMDIEKTTSEVKMAVERQDLLIEVDYLGTKYPIKNQKALFAYKQVEECKKRIADIQKISKADSREQDQETVLALYIEIFSSFDECMKVIQKEKSDEKNSDAENIIYSNVLSFLTLNKAQCVLERNIVLIKNAVQKFDNEDGVANLDFLTTKKAFKLKLTRPTEIIKLCDNLLQVFKQVIEVERQNPNLENYRKLDVLEFHFKAVRCYYVACVYLANKRYIETLSLLKMAENIAVNSAKKFEEMKGFFSEDYVEQTNKLQKKLKFLEIKAKLGLVENTNEEEQVITEQLRDSNLDGRIHNKTILSLVQETEEGAKLNIGISRFNSIPIMSFPPKPVLANIKPIQFDLVDSFLQYPKEETPKDKPAQSSSTFFKSLKFWK